MYLAGCDGYHYVSSPSFVPLNEKKGELHAMATFNAGQIGYSFTNHFSVFGTGYERMDDFNSPAWFGSEDDDGSIYTSDKGNEFNLGLSYFYPWENYRFEILSGGGIGYTDFEYQKDLYENDVFHMHADRANIFLQPDIGFKPNDIVEIGFFCRLNAYRYYNISASYSSFSYANNPPRKNDALFLDRKTMNLYFLEPGILARVGFKFLKIQTLISFTNNLSNYDISIRPANFYLVSIFLDLSFSEKKD